MICYILAMMALPAAGQHAAPRDASLDIRFENVKPHAGRILVTLHDAAHWPEGAPLRTLVVDAEASMPEARITDLPPGRYAVRAVHDLDGSGGLTLNPFAVPAEPYGFSGDASGRRGVPGWDAAAVLIAPGANMLSIILR